MKLSLPLFRTFALALAFAVPSIAHAAEATVASPDGRIVVVVSDVEGLRYRVTLDSQPALADSRLGLDFNGGFSLGRAAKITAAAPGAHDGTWENRFGPRRVVPDRYRELKLTLQENADAPKRLNLIVRAYDGQKMGRTLRSGLLSAERIVQLRIILEDVEALDVKAPKR